MVWLGINAGINLNWAIGPYGYVETVIDGVPARLISPFGYPYLMDDPAKLAGIINRARLTADTLRAVVWNIHAYSFMSYCSQRLTSLESQINSYRFRAAKAQDELLANAWNMEADAIEVIRSAITQEVHNTLMFQDTPLSDDVYGIRLTAAN